MHRATAEYWPFGRSPARAPAGRWRTRTERGELPPGVRPRRHRRRPWERRSEAFPGGVALRDLRTAPETARLRIVGRALVLRALDPRATPLPGEDAAALRYVRALPAGDAERRALERALLHPPSGGSSGRAHALCDAAAEAEAWGQLRGAFGLARRAWELSRLDPEPAGRAAARRAALQLGRIARTGGAPAAARRWARRAVGSDPATDGSGS